MIMYFNFSRKVIRKYILAVFFLGQCGVSFGSENINFGVVTIANGEQSLEIRSRAKLLKNIENVGGIYYWPWLNIGDDGVISSGNIEIISKTGTVRKLSNDKSMLSLGNGFSVQIQDRHSFSIQHNQHSCHFNSKEFGDFDSEYSIKELFSLGFLRLSSANTYLIALSKHRINIDDSEYKTSRIDFPSCKVLTSEPLPQQDFFVELGWTNKGGWWLVGSVEQTLFRSTNGVHWDKVNLPKDTQSLMSAYVKTEDEIWIAARTNPESAGTGPMLAKSGDRGKTWTEVNFQSKDIEGLPYYWLKGRIRSQSNSPR
jgi:hypothetical protein